MGQEEEEGRKEEEKERRKKGKREGGQKGHVIVQNPNFPEKRNRRSLPKSQNYCEEQKTSKTFQCRKAYVQASVVERCYEEMLVVENF